MDYEIVYPQDSVKAHGGLFYLLNQLGVGCLAQKRADSLFYKAYSGPQDKQLSLIHI